MSFESAVAQGSALGALKAATIYGSLWAIGSSWANAIREIARLVLPEDTMEAVLAEALAAGITTVLGVGVALLAARTWCTGFSQATPTSAACAAATHAAGAAGARRAHR